jgi:hypothetical protein
MTVDESHAVTVEEPHAVTSIQTPAADLISIQSTLSTTARFNSS